MRLCTYRRATGTVVGLQITPPAHSDMLREKLSTTLMTALSKERERDKERGSPYIVAWMLDYILSYDLVPLADVAG